MNKERKYTWHKLAESIESIRFSAEGIAPVQLEDKKICIILFKGQLFGCNAICPHAGGDLSAGYVDVSGNIVCPVHRYRFDLKNGRNSSGEGYFLKTYPVEKRENGIFVGIEEAGNFGRLK
jgi:nitrite reductase/ring-hydroxylating ferredoxin subunit